MNFGYVLRTLRVSANVGLRQLARDVGMSPTYLSLIENAKQPPPSAGKIEKIERALDVPAGYLLCLAQCSKSNVHSFFDAVPEAVDFLNVARESKMTSADFMDLTAFLNAYGWPKLREILEENTRRGPGNGFANSGRTRENEYIWPFLREEFVFDLEGVDRKEKFFEDAVGRIAGACETVDYKRLLNALLSRESVATTGVGHGLAVPHAYLEELENMIVSFTRIPKGLDFDSVDGEPVHMALVLAGPHSDGNLHLRLLARIAKLMHNNNFCKSIRNASDAAEIISIFKLAEMRIP
jgi:mannitol/fructose-specific phosphotransferase system IIA component (Ntr-type)/transcriptional regulator with XRE-family HTH domain